MKERKAYQLLFIENFGNGPLFKNQGYLAQELVNIRESSYYTEKTASDYSKRLGNLKVFVSQLFSDNTRRVVTSDFKKSLHEILKSKTLEHSFDHEAIADEIIDDLIQKNTSSKIEIHKEASSDLLVEFYSNMTNASYITIFSTREFKVEKNFSFTDFLIDDLIKSLFEGTQSKWYRFNFPLEQICSLFWIGVRKELIKYFIAYKYPLEPLVKTFYDNKVLSFKMDTLKLTEEDPNLASKISTGIVEYLSNNDIITVFHLKAPTYLIPTIALNPNDRQSSQTYCVLQSDSGIDNLHKLTRDEMLLWKFFVWDNLRLNNSGKPVKYSDIDNPK
jgi:hypothetical protein